MSKHSELADWIGKDSVKHKERLQKKVQRIAGLRDLMRTHEQFGSDHEELLKVRAELRNAENQLLAMRP